MTPKKVTIRDVAKNAGVSVGTVSKILSGRYLKDHVKFSRETIKRVNAAVRETGYQPNFAGQILSTGRTSTIGIYIPKLKQVGFYLGHYFADIIDSIEKKAVLEGYDLLLINYRSCVEKFVTNRIDGLIVIEQWDPDEDIIRLIGEKRPLVVINNRMAPSPPVCSVNLDTDESVEMLLGHLTGLGHTKIAFIGELTEPVQKEHRLRLDALRAGLVRRGLPVDEGIFLTGTSVGPAIDKSKSYYDQYSGAIGIEYLMTKCRGRFSAVFCANDLVALGAMDWLSKNGMKVPEDVSLVGFDDLDFTGFVMNGLTTIRQPLAEMGASAFEVLLELMKAEKRQEAEPKTLLLKPEMIVRNSVRRIG
jgi:LacI family transcriptional regulator